MDTQDSIMDSDQTHYTTHGRGRFLRDPNQYHVDKNRTIVESEYVSKYLGLILPKCLAEVCVKRPTDPIEYIAHWLYKNRENEIIQQMEAEEETRRQQERLDREREDELMALGRPDAPEPNSLHRLSSFKQSSFSSVPSVNTPPNSSIPSLNPPPSKQPEVKTVSSEPSAGDRHTPDLTSSGNRLAQEPGPPLD